MRFAAFWMRRASLAPMFSSEAPEPTRAVALPAVFAAVRVPAPAAPPAAAPPTPTPDDTRLLAAARLSAALNAIPAPARPRPSAPAGTAGTCAARSSTLLGRSERRSSTSQTDQGSDDERAGSSSDCYGCGRCSAVHRVLNLTIGSASDEEHDAIR